MKDVSDLEKTVISLKAGERMIAFAGFGMLLGPGGSRKDGILKISSFLRPEGSGYLTLTFVVDSGNDRETIDLLARMFKDAGLGAIQAGIGRDLEMIVNVPLDFLAQTHDLYVAELNLYFRRLRDREKVLIEEKVIPTLKDALHCELEPVEWLITERPPANLPPSHRVEAVSDRSAASLFRRWFGARR